MSDFPKVWVFDINARTYEIDANGRATGAPIWRAHWREMEIVGETKVSWVTSWGKKIPKKGGRGIAFSQDEIDRQAYMKDHRHRIADRVSRLDDYETMRAVAKLVGYES